MWVNWGKSKWMRSRWDSRIEPRTDSAVKWQVCSQANPLPGERMSGICLICDISITGSLSGFVFIYYVTVNVLHRNSRAKGRSGERSIAGRSIPGGTAPQGRERMQGPVTWRRFSHANQSSAVALFLYLTHSNAYCTAHWTSISTAAAWCPSLVLGPLSLAPPPAKTRRRSSCRTH